eukprot:3883725-Rhodomonas_salina.1
MPRPRCLPPTTPLRPVRYCPTVSCLPATCLRASYALSATALLYPLLPAYGPPMLCPLLTLCMLLGLRVGPRVASPDQLLPIVLCPCYALSGTGYTVLPIMLCACYGLSGTEAGYGATRSFGQLGFGSGKTTVPQVWLYLPTRTCLRNTPIFLRVSYAIRLRVSAYAVLHVSAYATLPDTRSRAAMWRRDHGNT